MGVMVQNKVAHFLAHGVSCHQVAAAVNIRLWCIVKGWPVSITVVQWLLCIRSACSQHRHL